MCLNTNTPNLKKSFPSKDSDLSSSSWINNGISTIADMIHPCFDFVSRVVNNNLILDPQNKPIARLQLPLRTSYDTSTYTHAVGTSTREMITICSKCRRIRSPTDDEWIDLQDFKKSNDDPYKFTWSHGFCNKCYTVEEHELDTGKSSPTSSWPHWLDSLTKKKKMVLVVDDNDLQRKIIKRMVERAGLECHVATNGAEAINMARITQYNLILMDCMMSEIDGWEAASVIRTFAGDSTFIVALTGLRKGEDLLTKCIEAGMNTLIHKPLTNTVLRKLLIDTPS